MATALAPVSVVAHDTGVSPTPGRRRFTAAYKMKILEEADRCIYNGDRGSIGALLRREGLYSSQLAAWRQARKEGELATHAALVQRRDHRPKVADPNAKRAADLERELARAVKRTERAKALVEVQKKVAALLDQIGHLDQLDQTKQPGLIASDGARTGQR